MISEVLRHRAYWFSVTLLGIIGVASVVILLAQPTYESSMQILLEPNAGDSKLLNNANENGSPLPVDTNIAALTEIRLMRSNQFVEQAIESLEQEQPELCHDKEVRTDCIKDFQDRLTITQLKEGGVKTRVVEVFFTGNQKEQTFKFLLALQKIYRAYNVEQQQERIDDRLAIFDYELSTGEKALSQVLGHSPQLYEEHSSALPKKSWLATDSAPQKESYRARSYEKEIDRAESYGQDVQTESEKVAAIQLIHLRQEMANNLIQSGFTWKLVEYPMIGRKVFSRPRPRLTMGLLINGFWAVFTAIAFSRR